MNRGAHSCFQRRVWALAVLAFGALADPAAASHFRYGTLSWAPTGTPGEVEFHLVASFRRDEYPGSDPVDHFAVTGDVIQENRGNTALAFDGAAGINGPFTQVLLFRVTSYNVTENWIIGDALDPLTGQFPRHTYDPPGPSFVAYVAGGGSGAPPVEFPGCCRIGEPGFPTTDTLANRAGLPYPLQTVVFPFTGNRSPVSSMVPIVVVPPSTSATFLVPAVDPDDDAITWRVSTDTEAGGPAPPPGMTIDSTTGVVTWNNLTSGPGGTPLTQAPTFWTTQFMIEDHDVLPLRVSTQSGRLVRRRPRQEIAGAPLQSVLGDAKTKTPVDFLLLIRPQVGNLPSCTISPSGPLTASVGDPFSFTVTATDADPGDNVTLSSGALPVGSAMIPGLPITGASPQSAQFQWTPTIADLGPHDVIFAASDTAGQQGLCSTIIRVIQNTAPPTCSVNPPGPHTVQAGMPLTFTITGADPDAGDTVVLDSADAPATATFTPPLPAFGVAPVSTQFDWTPAAGDVGPHVIHFTATDSANQTGQCSTTVEVTPNPNPPTCTISPPGPLSVEAGTLVGFTLTGNDPDAGDIVTLDLDGVVLPAGATMTPPLPFAGAPPVSSAFAWTPTAADVGPHNLAFVATDGAGQQGTCQTTVTVTVTNTTAPTCAINPVGPQTVPIGMPVSFTVTGTDPDQGDLLNLDLTSGPLPTGASLTPPLPINGATSPVSSQFNWIPTAIQTGPHTFSFLVTDAVGHQTACQTSVTVTNPSPPTCAINPPGPQTVPAGTAVTFAVTGTDPDLGDVLSLALTSGPLPAGAALAPPLPINGASSPVTSQLSWIPTAVQAGPHSFAFLVTDAAGQQGVCQTSVTVTNPTPPTCEISPPGPQTVPAGTAVTFGVTGTDPDLGDLLSLDLTSGPLPAGASLTPPLPINGASSPVSSQFNWTPTAVQAGPHTFMFLVSDAAGQQSTCQTLVTVTNANPPTCTINPAGPQTVTAGSPASFTVTGADPDLGDLLDLALTSALPAGAAMTPALPLTDLPSPVSSQFNWTPTPADAGPHTFSFQVTDFAGQQASCQTSIQVIANVPPTITCPSPVAIEGCNVPGGQQVPLTVHVEDANGDALTVTWVVDGAVVQVDHVPSGGATTSADVTLVRVFGLGNHVISVSVTDGQSTAVSCQTTVSVTDTRAPVLTCSSAQTMLWPPNHNLINVGFQSRAADSCDASIVPVVQVFADEDDEEQTGDGHHSPDAKGIASGTLRLRSERKGNADGRVYLMLTQGTDDAGNTGLQCCAVTVPHSQSRKDKNDVLAQAAAAVAACQATGAPPPGFVTVGDGPIIGPKQ